VPLAIRLRRTAERPFVRSLARHASKLNFSTFLLVVVVVGALAPGVMLLEFSPGAGTGGSTVTADVACDAGESTVSCRVDVTGEVDHVAVVAGGEVIRTLDEPPYAFEVERSELAETGVGRQFVVELRDADGDTLRRFVQTAPAS
jgi:multidrug resistance efflux pump